MTPAQIALHTDGAVSCGTRLWRFRGRLQLTVVVKAVFAIVPDGIATPSGPGAIVAEERHRDGHPMHSVEAASDLAPYLPRCDVLFVGHAHAVSAPAAAGAVRLGLSREGQRLLDKTIHVYGERGLAAAPEPFTRMPIVYERAARGPGAENPAGSETPNLADPGDPQRPAGFGPISRNWPARRRLLKHLDRQSLAGPIVEIPEAMPWEYFQSAPPDQQIDPLRGGEWLVLDGLHPTRPRVQTRLPSARGGARVAGPGGALAALALVCDTLAIDGDRQIFSLSWRGQHDLTEAEASLSSLVVLGALEVPGVPPDWARIRSTAALGAPRAPPSKALEQTISPEPSSIGAAGPAAALPFSPAEAPRPGEGGSGPRAPGREATPWSPEPARPAPVAVPGEATLAPQASPLARGKAREKGKTMAMPAMQHMALASQPAVPFKVSERAPARAPDETSATPWSPIPVQPVLPPREDEPVTAELPPVDPGLLPAAAPAPAPEAPVVAPLHTEPPPAMIAPPPPKPDPWARPSEPQPEAPGPAPPPQPAAFERPAAAAVKSSFYAKFKS